MKRERNYLAHYLDLVDAQTHQQLGYVGDVSETGLMFITQLSIPSNEVKDVYIEHKISSPDIPHCSIKAKIKTLWEKPNINSELHCIGCSILEISHEDQQRLKELVAMISFDSNFEIRRTKHD